MNYSGFGAGLPAFSPFIGAQAGGNDLAIAPGAAVYPAAKATVPTVTKAAQAETSAGHTRRSNGTQATAISA